MQGNNQTTTQTYHSKIIIRLFKVQKFLLDWILQRISDSNKNTLLSGTLMPISTENADSCLRHNTRKYVNMYTRIGI